MRTQEISDYYDFENGIQQISVFLYNPWAVITVEPDGVLWRTSVRSRVDIDGSIALPPPGQGDLDTPRSAEEGGFLSYDLPPDMYGSTK